MHSKASNLDSKYTQYQRTVTSVMTAKQFSKLRRQLLHFSLKQPAEKWKKHLSLFFIDCPKI